MELSEHAKEYFEWGLPIQPLWTRQLLLAKVLCGLASASSATTLATSSRHSQSQ